MSEDFTNTLWFAVLFGATCGMLFSTGWQWIAHKVTVESLLEDILDELRNRHE